MKHFLLVVAAAILASVVASGNTRGAKSGKKGGQNDKSGGHGKKGGKGSLEVLEKAVKAIGGWDNLKAMEGIMMVATGSVRMLFEDSSSEGALGQATYNREYHLTHDKLRIDETIYPGEAFPVLTAPATLTTIFVGMVGTTIGDRWVTPEGEVPSHTVGAFQQQQFLFNPHLMLQKAYMDPSMILNSYTSNDYLVLILGNEHGSNVYVYIDAITGVIDKLKVMESNPLVMDVWVTVRFSQWTMASTGGLYFPMSVKEYTSFNNEMIWSETRTQVAIVEFDHALFGGIPDPPELLNIDGYKFGLKTQHNTASFPYGIGLDYPYDPQRFHAVPLVPAMVWWWPSTSVGTVAIRDPGTNGLILLEAPGSSQQIVRLWGLMNEDLVFDWFVKDIIQTHHHVDHAGGVRELLGLSKQATDKGPLDKEDAKLVVGHGAGEFWDQVLQAPATIMPDTLSQIKDYDPNVVEVSQVDGSTIVLNNPGVRITAHHTTRDPHADDAIITVIEIWGTILVYQADMYNAGVGAPSTFAGGPSGFFTALREKKVIDETCASPLPLFIIAAHTGRPVTLQEAITELCSYELDVGCACPTRL